MPRKKKIQEAEGVLDVRGSVPVRLEDDGALVDVKTGEIVDPVSVLKNSDIYITGANTNTIGSLATGVAIPTYYKKSWDYLKEVQDFRDVADGDIYKHIDVCNKLYRFEPVIGTAIDLFVDFAISNLFIKTDNEKLNGIIKYLYDNFNKFPSTSEYLFPYPSGLKAFIKEIACEWFISGNVFPINEFYRREIDGEEYSIPLKTLNLNPLSVRIERNQERMRLGTVKLYYSPSGYYMGNTDGGNGTTINYNNNSPAYLSTELLSLTKGNETPLDHSLIYHIKRKYSGYKLWGIPYLTRTFTAVKAKRKLRALDDSTIDGLINFLIIFKVGSTDPNSPYHKVSSSRISAFEALVKNPQASNMIVWPHDIEIITAGPDGSVLDFKERYDIVDRDIIRSLGIPPMLLDGTGSTGMNWLPILSLVERLEDAREAISDYVRHLVTVIADKNDLEFKDLKVRWSPSNLRDEKTIKTLLLAFYDRGLLPIETTLEQGNYDFKDVLELKKKEKKEKLFELFERPSIPFSPVGNKETNKPAQENNFNRNGDEGRPVDNTENKVIKGTLTENITNELNNLYEEIKTGFKYDNKIEDKILAHFMRIKNISDIYINIEIASLRNSFDNFSESFDSWRIKYLDLIMDSMKEELSSNLAYLRKESVAKYVTAGVFSTIKDKLKVYSDDVLSLLSVADSINNKIKNGVESAFISFGENKPYKVELKDFFTHIYFDNLKNMKIKYIEEV